MRKRPTAYDFIQPASEMTKMMIESQMVIVMRIWGMAGAWPMAKAEEARMVDEKIAAVQDAGLAAARAMAAGAGPATIALAAMKPVRRRTKANVKRLSRAVTGAGKV